MNFFVNINTVKSYSYVIYDIIKCSFPHLRAGLKTKSRDKCGIQGGYPFSGGVWGCDTPQNCSGVQHSLHCVLVESAGLSVLPGKSGGKGRGQPDKGAFGKLFELFAYLVGLKAEAVKTVAFLI